MLRFLLFHFVIFGCMGFGHFLFHLGSFLLIFLYLSRKYMVATGKEILFRMMLACQQILFSRNQYKAKKPLNCTNKLSFLSQVSYFPTFSQF